MNGIPMNLCICMLCRNSLTQILSFMKGLQHYSVEAADILWLEGSVLRAGPWYLHEVVSAWAASGDPAAALAWAEQQQEPFVKAVSLAGVAEGVARRASGTPYPVDFRQERLF